VKAAAMASFDTGLLTLHLPGGTEEYDKNIISDDRQCTIPRFQRDTSWIQATTTSAWANLLSKSQSNGQQDGIQQTISAYFSHQV